MRTTRLQYVLIVSAILAGGSALLLCPALSESETSERSVLALVSGSDCARDNDSVPAARWSARLVDDDNSPDSTDDDGDDAPDGVIAAAPHRIAVALNGVLLAHSALVSAYWADFGIRALRGPPAELPDDSSSQDSDDDDDDDAPDAIIGAAPIRPIDLQTTFFIHKSLVATYAADVDADPLRGPPSLALNSSDARGHERFFHTLDDGHSLYGAFAGESLRAPP